MLTEIDLPIAELLLDPNNPRFISGFNELVEIPDERIDDKQLDTLRRFSRTQPGDDPELDVTNIHDLYDSMLQIGYVGIDRIVVRPLKGSKKYLVLEGNRRIAAVKSILRDYDNKLPPLDDPNKRKSVEKHRPFLNTITVKVLDTKGLSKREIAHQVSVLLGIRHHGSLLEWGPLPSAFNIYTEYMSEDPQTDAFRFDNIKAKAVAERLCIQKGDVTGALRTYVAYLQLKDRFPVRKDHYSLIESGIKDRHLKNSYFKVDEDTFTPDERSLTKLDVVCQFATRDSNDPTLTTTRKKKILRDPKQFKQLGRLVDRMRQAKNPAIKSYANDLIQRVEDENDLDMSVDDAVDELTAFVNRAQWADEVTKLLARRQEKLPLEEYKGDGADRGHKDDLKKTLEPLRKIMSI